MNENDSTNDRMQPAPQGEEGRAKHGYRNEVSWDGGKGRQPYANQEEELGPAAAHESEAGNRGAASGRNQEDLEAVKRMPGEPPSGTPRQDVAGRDGVK